MARTSTTSAMVILLHIPKACPWTHTTRYRSMTSEGCIAIFTITLEALQPGTVDSY
ncbi:hypothetical protein BHE74_00023363 [Ensete ventricosum]|nr:hypothetical protein GW17_00042642 [Ensete ventricosum]RWW69080.1 hypothetical protein BHE74_00023363 [Ensete ventricosum]RZS15965.1 hypothetical protein BHM03_00047892 [Ensete ventricosum]